MTVYRYRDTGPNEANVEAVAGDVTFGSSTTSFVDITADPAQKADLDEAMLAEGYVFDTEAPVSTVDQQTLEGLGVTYALDLAFYAKDTVVTYLVNGDVDKIEVTKGTRKKTDQFSYDVDSNLIGVVTTVEDV